MRPNRRVARAYASRGSRVWLGTRALVAVLFMLGRVDPVRLRATSVMLLVVGTVVLCFLDVHRRRERALLGNLGTSVGSLGVLFAGPAILGELVIAFLVFGFG